LRKTAERGNKMGILILPNESIIISQQDNRFWSDKTINSILSRTPAARGVIF
jgi:hypothetical protein